MSNHSILEQNMLYGFSETAGMLYLKLIDVFQGCEKKAFLAAYYYECKAGAALDHILTFMPKAPDEKTKAELSKFFSERWRNNFMDMVI